MAYFMDNFDILVKRFGDSYGISYCRSPFRLSLRLADTG
jgi:hypothetical protein